MAGRPLLLCAKVEVLQMWSSARVVAAVVVVALLAVAAAEPGYPQPTPCYPITKYVTHYQTQLQQVSSRVIPKG